ncbi:MAG: response regulator [Treponema sp.]|jgi:signal transduction histidine kinase/CheY-like chemotaxis protein/HPt (histidine-containing phosphotransfer) domain-containing protein|nr:response regulator [Treponema sp.]
MTIGAILSHNYKQLIFVGLVFFTMVLISNVFVSGIVEQYMYANAAGMLTIAESTVESRLREGRISILSTALAIRNRLERGQSLEEINRYLIEMTGWLRDHQEGIPGFISIYGAIGGEFFDGSGWRPPAQYAPELRPWYVTAIEDPEKITISTPYPDARDGSKIISISLAIMGSAGEFYGVLSYDINFNSITAYVESLRLAQAGYGMLLGPDMSFIAHPDTSFLGKPLESLGGGYIETMRRFAQGDGQVSMIKLSNNHGDQYIAFFQRMRNGWHIGIAIPALNYYQDVYLMAAVMTVCGIGMGGILCAILVRLNSAKLRADEESRSKSSFLARMSHEIRTPMNSILGVSEIMLRKNMSGENYEYVSIIQQSANALLSVINDVLDFSKIESGRIEIASQEYCMSSLLHDVITIIRVRVAEKLDFFVTVDSAIPAKLIGDCAHIRQILINLLNNAVKYTREGHIALGVSMERLDAHRIKLLFSVQDTGIGIREEDKKNLFAEFTRIDGEKNQGIEGSGLGLAIANTLCKAMGGEIQVESEYGKGSRFTAVITQRCEDAGPMARVERPDARVLLFEDRPRHAEAALSALRSLGIAPVYAKSLNAFLEELENGDYQFAFISSIYARRCLALAGKDGAPRLVIMTELGDVSAYREADSIRMPIYANLAANALNGAPSPRDAARDWRISFTAPEARVLIVDDLPTNLRVAAELMAPYRMTVDTCLAGQEAVELVKKNRYDLLFMDHMMPGMDGLEAAALIKQNEACRHIPIIMLTANVVADQRDLFLKNGLSDYLSKPIETKKLNALLESYLPREKQISLDAQDRAGPDDAVFDLPGVAAKDGLFNVGGSLSAYRNVLAVFGGDMRKRIPQMREYLAQGNVDQYTILVHAVKGAARSIGAHALSALAAELEEAGRNQNLQAIQEKNGGFLQDLAALAENIAALLGEDFLASALAAF